MLKRKLFKQITELGEEIKICSQEIVSIKSILKSFIMDLKIFYWCLIRLYFLKYYIRNTTHILLKQQGVIAQASTALTVFPQKINMSLLFCIIYIVNFDNRQFAITDVCYGGSHRSRFNGGCNCTMNHIIWQIMFQSFKLFKNVFVVSSGTSSLAWRWSARLNQSCRENSCPARLVTSC